VQVLHEEKPEREKYLQSSFSWTNSHIMTVRDKEWGNQLSMEGEDFL